MTDRYPHVFSYYGATCEYCRHQERFLNRDDECYARLRAALDQAADRVAELEAKYCNHDVTAILTVDGNNRLRGVL